MRPASILEVPFVSGTIRDGERSGRGQYRLVTFATANADTSFALTLGHVPAGYLTLRNAPGGVVYDGTNLGSDWTASLIVLRASIAGNYTLWIV